MATESRLRKETKSLAPCTEELHRLRKQDFIPLEDSTARAQFPLPRQVQTGNSVLVPRPLLSRAQALTVPRKTTFPGKWMDPTLRSLGPLPTYQCESWLAVSESDIS